MKIIVETMCDSLRDCVITEQAGADRIELNSGTHLGGLTPSLGLLRSAKTAVKIPILTMIRCRMGGFVYNQTELQTMQKDAKIMLENGADGIVFGFLNDDLTINKHITQSFVNLTHEYGKEAIFHRAFDRVTDPIKAIETLIELGVDRVLTSGLKPSVTDGLDLIKTLQSQYGDQIEILPGAGITHDNIIDIIEKTHVTQVHASFKEPIHPKGSQFKDIPALDETYHQIGEENLKKALLKLEGL